MARGEDAGSPHAVSGEVSSDAAAHGADAAAQAPGTTVRCLLVTSIFAPINGGSAVVYENLCRYGPAGSMQALAPTHHYETGEALEGWREHDKRAPFKVHRLALLRPLARRHRSRLLKLALWLGSDLPLRARVLWAAMRIVRRERIDVVCIGELVSGAWLGLALKRVLGTRLIFYIHGEEVTTVTPYRFYGRRRKQHLARADAVVAVSGFTRQALIELMDVADDKIALIYNGVDLARFSPGPRNPALLRRYALDGKQVLLTVGRLVPRKGIDTTIRALPALLDTFPDLHYLVVGRGPYRADLEALAAELGVSRHVSFAGGVPDDELVDHYRLCDLFVMPNRELANHDTEGFGLVFLEANACGKPVIGGRAGGVVEAVRDGQNGLLVDGDDVAALERTIASVLGDAAFADALATRGLAIAQASGWESRAQQFNRLCARLLRGQG